MKLRGFLNIRSYDFKVLNSIVSGPRTLEQTQRQAVALLRGAIPLYIRLYL